MKITIISICLAVCGYAIGQTHQYTIKMGDKEIGQIDASVVRSGNSMIYSVNSNSNVSMLFSIHYTSQLEAVYQDGVLLGASSVSYQNSKKKDDSIVAKRGGRYYYKDINGKELGYGAPIRYSVAMLYFIEPKGRSLIYSETHGTFCQLTSSDEGVCTLTLPDGNKNYYHYRDGKLLKVIIKRTAYDLSFHLITEN